MRVLFKIDVPDYKPTREVCDLLCKLGDELQKRAWQELSGQVVGWEIER